MTRAEAKKLGLKHYNTGVPCAHGHTADRFVSSQRCLECASAYATNNTEVVRANWHRWVDDNRDKENARLRAFHKGHPDKAAIRGKAWREKYPDKHCAKEARRRSKKLNATPIWADQEAIADKYEFCKLWSELIGREYEVDHIVPLQGKQATGLHVVDNLRIITAKENREKSNKLTFVDF